ncbi:MAG: hypothetical protein CMB67_00780 [Euryarchaeota archaeon]|mgnify:CR=1 FL=1|nr:hypothetical protein [Euryarchaeota archaeon]|tara:strand:+ start:430 stop:1218 length:789 start_codon:yes stop_codon:yes gene_type:complete
MVAEHRDPELELALQASLDNGNSVWIVGDIHGYRAEFELLLDKLDLSAGDMVLCVGDLVDRGPDSHGVISIVRESDQISSIKGNHELIMSQALLGDRNREAFWINKVGGMATLQSMPGGDNQEKWERAVEWLDFTDALPSEVVIDRFRICHSGYRIDIPFEDQTEEDRLKSREAFLATQPLDEKRQIIAGHTPIQMLYRFGLEPPKEGVWMSDVVLKDGRPSVALIDTGIVLKDPAHRPRISAYDLQTGSIAEIERINQILT